VSVAVRCSVLQCVAACNMRTEIAYRSRACIVRGICSVLTMCAWSWNTIETLSVLGRASASQTRIKNRWFVSVTRKKRLFVSGTSKTRRFMSVTRLKTHIFQTPQNHFISLGARHRRICGVTDANHLFSTDDSCL